MAVICPTVTAFGLHDYRDQMELLESFAERIHIDLMDGEFAPTKSPDLESIWWPEKLIADIHLMYLRPEEQLEQLFKLNPHLVIIHAEAEADHAAFASRLQERGIKAGLALLSDTSVEDVLPLLPSFDHALVFSGKLGYHGGEADLALLDKVKRIREEYPDIEISWDGGINDQNARRLVAAGVEVLNVGGFIHNAPDPQQAYMQLKS